MESQCWMCRQNPNANTNQEQYRNLNISHNILTCPFGHFGVSRSNIIDGIYNENRLKWPSKSQDRIFIEEISIGDYVLIPYYNMDYCVLAKIISTPIYIIETGLFININEDEIKLSDHYDEGYIHFRPIGRKIQIISENVKVDLSKISRQTLSKLDKTLIQQYI
jgi:hypothetical protein